MKEMSIDLHAVVAGLRDSGLPPEGVRDLLSWLACGHPYVDVHVVLLKLTGTSDQPAIAFDPAAHGSPEAGSRRGERPRLWTVPAAALLDTHQSFDGLEILSEFGQGETATLLWQVYRDLLLWAQTPAARRRALFSKGASPRRRTQIADARLSEALDVWVSVLAAVVQYPTAVRPATVALACHELARLMARDGKLGTSLCFARAAAAVVPRSSAAAYLLGTAALRSKRTAYAETWLRRSVTLARRSSQWPTYGSALLALAALHYERGERTSARDYFERALKVGRRCGKPGLRAASIFGLLRLSSDAGRVDEASNWAERLLGLLRRNRGGSLPEVQVETAALEIRREQFVKAIRSLDRVVQRPAISTPICARAIALLAFAAAATGDRARYLECWEKACTLLNSIDLPQDRAPVIVEMVRSALTMNDEARADWAARLNADHPTRVPEPQIWDVIEIIESHFAAKEPRLTS